MLTRKPRSAARELVIAGLAILIAIYTGVDWLGKPLRLVHVLTLVAELQCKSNRMETDGLFIVVSDSFERCGQRPNKRLKLTARVDCGMNLSSARRSLSAIR